MDSDLISTHLIKCLSTCQNLSFLSEEETSDEAPQEENKNPTEEEQLSTLFQNLQNPLKRQEALLELSLMEDTCKDLAVHIFYSSSTLAIL